MGERSNTAAKARITAAKLPAVMARTGLSASSIYRLVSENRFPKPFKLADTASAWIDEEITSWLEARVEERDRLAREEGQRKASQTEAKAGE